MDRRRATICKSRIDYPKLGLMRLTGKSPVLRPPSRCGYSSPMNKEGAGISMFIIIIIIISVIIIISIIVSIIIGVGSMGAGPI